MNPTQIHSNEIRSFAAGTWGGEFHPEFGPREGDVIVLEHWAQSSFANRTDCSPSDEMHLEELTHRLCNELEELTTDVPAWRKHLQQQLQRDIN
jgi:nicotinamidase-related amidase